MKDLSIRLRSLDQVNRFIRVVDRLDNRVALISDNSKVDGKALLGILSLDLTKPLSLRLDKAYKDPKGLEELKEFIV